jgi:hypothetical protein
MENTLKIDYNGRNFNTACPGIGAIPMNSRIVITKEIQICKKIVQASRIKELGIV